jgi:hypothetical protein
MARYLDIQPLQEPFDDGKEGNHQRVTFNITVSKTESETFEEELIKILTDASVGDSENIFASSKAAVPEGDGPFLHVIATGGASPLRIHNVISPPAYPQPTAQLVTRAKSYKAARAMARAAYLALAAIRNTTVTP